MAQSKSKKRFRYKLIGIALLAVVAGIVLLKLSCYFSPDEKAEPTTTASAPSSDQQTPDKSPEEASAQNVAGLLLLFSMACFLLMVLCLGWVAINIYNSRPSWKTQTKYPKKR